ncbi:unnamed protein product [Protopolystoma xenopodis]|uniref:Uncharacterized protein n=1 Tax=Protopolystoma xenopodis TaxID=117903 RepID=A0A3S5CQZ3_9PLAT|nr:unnamed protein product [Protopolystoma xenopodis]
MGPKWEKFTSDPVVIYCGKQADLSGDTRHFADFIEAADGPSTFDCPSSLCCWSLLVGMFTIPITFTGRDVRGDAVGPICRRHLPHLWGILPSRRGLLDLR